MTRLTIDRITVDGELYIEIEVGREKIRLKAEDASVFGKNLIEAAADPLRWDSKARANLPALG